jgi:hypothetical protein
MSLQRIETLSAERVETQQRWVQLPAVDPWQRSVGIAKFGHHFFKIHSPWGESSLGEERGEGRSGSRCRNDARLQIPPRPLLRPTLPRAGG